MELLRINLKRARKSGINRQYFILKCEQDNRQRVCFQTDMIISLGKRCRIVAINFIATEEPSSHGQM
jgi:hypothetical protein